MARTATSLLRATGLLPMIKRVTDQRALDSYLKSRAPFTRGYLLHHQSTLNETIHDAGIMAAFREGKPLPNQYGYGLDERVVEYPWLFSQMTSGEGYVLDAGSVLNHAFMMPLIKSYPAWQKKKLHILTLAPERDAFWREGISYLYDDLRNIPMRDELYDTILCISTLEHVGMDNTGYTRSQQDKENRPKDFTTAMQELRRIMKPGGQLLLTVPFGKYHHFGGFQQFDQPLLDEAIKAFGEAVVTSRFYLYTAQGWNQADAQACASAEYVDRSRDVHRVEPDGAATARAVACIRFQKP